METGRGELKIYYMCLLSFLNETFINEASASENDNSCSKWPVLGVQPPPRQISLSLLFIFFDQDHLQHTPPGGRTCLNNSY